MVSYTNESNINALWVQKTMVWKKKKPQKNWKILNSQYLLILLTMLPCWPGTGSEGHCFTVVLLSLCPLSVSAGGKGKVKTPVPYYVGCLMAWLFLLSYLTSTRSRWERSFWWHEVWCHPYADDTQLHISTPCWANWCHLGAGSVLKKL